MDDEPQSQAGWAASLPGSMLRPRARWWLWILRISGTLAAITLTVLGPLHTSSLDLPLTGTTRYGLYGNQLPVEWVCPDGHTHRSLPFWMGALIVAVPTVAFWLLLPRPRRR